MLWTMSAHQLPLEVAVSEGKASSSKDGLILEESITSGDTCGLVGVEAIGVEAKSLRSGCGESVGTGIALVGNGWQMDTIVGRNLDE